MEEPRASLLGLEANLGRDRGARDLLALERRAVEEHGTVALEALPGREQLAQADLVGQRLSPPLGVAPRAGRGDDQRSGRGHVGLLDEVAVLVLADAAQQSDLL